MKSRLPFLDRMNEAAPAWPALYCDAEARWTTYGDLARQVSRSAEAFARRRRQLAFLLFSNTRRDVVAYLGLLAAGHVPALIDPRLDAGLREGLLDSYRPEMLVGGGATRPGSAWRPIAGSPTEAWELPGPDQPEIHPDLCLLLTTSGSTGSPKMVRLSAQALAHNTEAIAQTLAIDRRDCAVAHLPLHYSYGLSILHTHLLVGARLVLTARSMIETDFWALLRGEDCSMLPGTPFHYRMIDRLGLDRLDVPGLSVLTQAGGRLGSELVQKMHRVMTARGGRFHVMYGQTEAAPRMTTLRHEDIPRHPASVGHALPGGGIDIVDASGQLLPAGDIGEVVYRGPNVMMGYAQERRDLAQGDAMGGVLHTGDLGYLDAEGFLFLTGRANRFAKVAGLRINLDDVEKLAAGDADRRIAVVEAKGGIVLFAENLDKAQATALRRALAKKLRIAPHLLSVRDIDAVPVTDKGKVDYPRLRERT